MAHASHYRNELAVMGRVRTVWARHAAPIAYAPLEDPFLVFETTLFGAAPYNISGLSVVITYVCFTYLL